MPSHPPWVCPCPDVFNAHDLNVLAKCEWDQWQVVVRILKETGAVTDVDCTSMATMRETLGQELFQALKEWGDLKSELDFQYAHRPK